MSEWLNKISKKGNYKVHSRLNICWLQNTIVNHVSLQKIEKRGKKCVSDECINTFLFFSTRRLSKERGDFLWLLVSFPHNLSDKPEPVKPRPGAGGVPEAPPTLFGGQFFSDLLTCWEEDSYKERAKSKEKVIIILSHNNFHKLGCIILGLVHLKKIITWCCSNGCWPEVFTAVLHRLAILLL